MRLGFPDFGPPFSAAEPLATAKGLSLPDVGVQIAETAQNSSRLLVISLASSGLAQLVLIAGLAIAHGSFSGLWLHLPTPPGIQSVESAAATTAVLIQIEEHEADDSSATTPALQIAVDAESDRVDLESERQMLITRREDSTSREPVLVSKLEPPPISHETGTEAVSPPHVKKEIPADDLIFANDVSAVPRQAVSRIVQPAVEPVKLPVTTPPAPTNAVAALASEGAKSDSPPVPIFNPSPEYPADALTARLTGRVILRVRVLANGTVESAAVQRSSGVKSLDEAALTAVRRWRFESRSAAVATAAREVAVPIRFVLED